MGRFGNVMLTGSYHPRAAAQAGDVIRFFLTNTAYPHLQHQGRA